MARLPLLVAAGQDPFEGLGEVGGHGRVDVLIGPGADDREDRLRLRRRVHRYQPGRGAGFLDSGDDLVVGLLEPREVDQERIRAEPLDFLEEGGPVPDLRLLEENAGRQALKTGLRLLPQLLGLDDHSKCDRLRQKFSSASVFDCLRAGLGAHFGAHA